MNANILLKNDTMAQRTLFQIIFKISQFHNSAINNIIEHKRINKIIEINVQVGAPVVWQIRHGLTNI